VAGSRPLSAAAFDLPGGPPMSGRILPFYRAWSSGLASWPVCQLLDVPSKLPSRRRDPSRYQPVWAL